jgi:predicted nucleic acid-binding protein
MRRAGAPIIIPAPVLAEVLRGTPRDAPVHRVLRIFDAERPMSPAAARHAGSLLGATRSHPARTLDALIVATALEHGATTILTQDERDIAALAPPRLAVLSI